MLAHEPQHARHVSDARASYSHTVVILVPLGSHHSVLRVNFLFVGVIPRGVPTDAAQCDALLLDGLFRKEFQ